MPHDFSSLSTQMPRKPAEAVDPPTIIWEQLAQSIEAFVEAWKGAADPPELLRYAPTSPPTLRRLALIELVKVDLEWRWQRVEWRKPLEQYAAELPELCAGDELPADLVYEELHLRKEHGECLAPSDGQEPSRQQATLLSVLLASDQGAAGSSVRRRRAAFDFKPGQSVDDFDLLAMLGRGAFGCVFLALQRSLARMVALKITADSGFETQTMAQLDHPHIVRVYDRRQLSDQGVQLIYMQFVPGGTLHAVIQRVRDTAPSRRTGKLMLECIDQQLLARNEAPPTDSRTRQFLARCTWPQAVCWLGASLAEALEHAHARGVLHRDLKPANVLLAADGSPKLADFNISSCATLPGASSAAYFGGSLAYMSPEQLDIYCGIGSLGPEALDERSDLFSLGLLLWELLTGGRLFCEDQHFNLSPASLRQMSTLRRQGLDDVALHKLPPDCPQGLVDSLRACLEAEPSNRVGSAGELRRQLELALHPDTYRLLNPPQDSWARRVANHPLPLLLAFGLLPNAGASVLSIAYNFPAILQQVHDPAVPGIFRTQVLTVNPIAFALGIGLIIGLTWPVLRAAKCRKPNDKAAKYRKRSLYLGDYVAWVSGPEWLVSGLVFPLWLHIALGYSRALVASQYIHFFMSQTICGLLAVTLSFLLVTLYSLRVVTPRLLDHDRDDPEMWLALGDLARRTSLHTRLAFIVVPLALVAISFVDVQSRSVFSVLGIVGLVAWTVAVVIARQIQRCIVALQRAVNLQASSHQGDSVDPLSIPSEIDDLPV